jgi:hypothetical protein
MRRFLIAAVAALALAFYAAGVGTPAASANACPGSFYYTQTDVTSGVASGQTWGAYLDEGLAGVTPTGHVLIHMFGGRTTYSIEVGLFSGWIGDGNGNVYYTAGVAPFSAVSSDQIHYSVWQGGNIPAGSHAQIWLGHVSQNVWTTYYNGAAIQSLGLGGPSVLAGVGTEDAPNQGTCGNIDATIDSSNFALSSPTCIATPGGTVPCGTQTNNSGCRFSVHGGLNKGFESYRSSPYFGCVSAYNNCPPNCPARPAEQPPANPTLGFAPPPSVKPRFTGWERYAPTP